MGVVFACEGMLKFLRPDALGTGRFHKLDIPAHRIIVNIDDATIVILSDTQQHAHAAMP
ncbi:hypothetical protein [Mycobacterium ostraviense]|uniref:hypothetical protein n=1 Tax=Mycobacterium ostraviense TaxID=2738409 RepID=UPI000A598480|nr:hypothetical protein [Mycobacterium ostraviense]UGT93482.1 hypothetical protein LTS72_09565 [Mycobacterium ostraviense]